ncbi:cdsA [Symbiodinium sp. CCMP2592]|nr:cdsA [Symbiodinium sp. CCMP2592]
MLCAPSGECELHTMSQFKLLSLFPHAATFGSDSVVAVVGAFLPAMPKASSPDATLRRRGRTDSADFRGNTTEEDTDLADDPKSEQESAALRTAQSNEGGERLLSKVKMKKMMVRAVMGISMMVTFGGVIYLGHCYLCLLVFALQCFIFFELVGVRKRQAAEKRLPLFRSIQWAWFFVAAFFTWSASICQFLENSPRFTASWSVARLVLENNMLVSFSLYTLLLMVSVLSLRKGLYKYQITQYTWTMVTICIVVFQTQAVFHLIYAGLFWFVLPSSLVICNDIMAYYCGQLFGKKLIRRRFLELSPNKTWEGFLGSAVCTMLFALWFSRKLCAYKWMTCVPEEITLSVHALSCEPGQMYRPQSIDSIIVDALPSGMRASWRVLAGSIPVLNAVGQLEICRAQIHALSLGFFASFAAPFGGFLSSAIKRAYGIKDFNNLIPGHGGMMDRFDCQFVMFLCTYVHIRTFCQTPVTVEMLLATAARLSLSEKQVLIDRLQEQVAAR